MELTLRTSYVELCVRSKPTYCVTLETFLPPQIAIRVGKYVWSTGKGFRKLFKDEK